MSIILFSDIDGTLSQNRTISERDIEAIHRFRAAGNLFVFCTGRTPPSVQHILDAYPQLECDGAVLAGGSGIYSVEGNPSSLKLIEQNTIDRQVSWEILSYIYENEPKVSIHWSDGPRRISIKDRYVHKSNVPSPDFMSIDEWKAELSDMLILVLVQMDEDPLEIQRVQKDILARWGQHVEGFTNRYYLDISVKNSHKGSGILRALQIWNTSKHFGVGDGFNDIPMFKALGKDNSFLISSGEKSLQDIVKTSVSTVADCIDLIME
ncbi:MAG: HAD-IIB family hydrolase [Brevinema sp.]